MRKSILTLFGSEWFGVSISTLAVAQVYILFSGEFSNLFFNYVAEIFSLFGLTIFVIVFIVWVIRAFIISDGVFSHWNNLTRMSFVSLIPITMFVGTYQLIYYFGISQTSAEISLIIYYSNYILALLLGVLLGYRLYTKPINPGELNYSIVIPPLAIGTSVFLAGPLMKFYGGIEAQTMYFLVLVGLGIFFFLFLFIGSLALAGHVTTKTPDSLPTTMLPVGISSLIIINLFSIAGFGKIDQISISISTVEFLSIILWGFEVWNFLVVLILIFTNPARGKLSVWAYGFPLGLFATSTMRIYTFTQFTILLWIFAAIGIMLTILWIYAWINTGMFLKIQREMESKEQTALPKIPSPP